MTDEDIIVNRRDEIGQRWLRGESQSAIALALDVPLDTVQDDLAAIRAGLMAGTHEVLQMARARTMAGTEQVIAQAWRHLERVSASATPDEAAIAAYFGIILKGHAQLGKLAGLHDVKPGFNFEHNILNKTLYDHAAESDPLQASTQALMKSLLEPPAPPQHKKRRAPVR